MARCVWVTDIHLNFVRDEGRRSEFFRSTKGCNPGVVLLSGDISEGPDVCRDLREIEAGVDRPILFVLGNHDFYRSSFRRVLSDVEQLVADAEHLVYLSASDPVKLTESTAVVGHDGWGDGRLGDLEGSAQLESISDFFFIEEFAEMHWDRRQIRERIEALGSRAAAHLRHVLRQALEQHRRVVVVTHVPPFREAARYDGKPSADDWLPFFACKATGDVLLDAAHRWPDREILVLCGHTHGGGEVQVRENLRVLTGPAEYGKPQVNRVFEFD